MKQLLLFTAVCVLSCTLTNAQNLTDDLLNRYENLDSNGNSPSHYFTPEEQLLLRDYLQSGLNQTVDRQTGGTLIHGPINSENEFGNFDPGDLTTFNTLGPSLTSTDFESSGDIDPNNLTMGYVLTLSSGEFYSIDVTTGTYTSMGTIAPPAGQQWNGIEFDPATGTLYGVSSDFSSVSSISTIDVGAMSHTLVGNIGSLGAIAIAITDTGEMYAYDVVDDNFYSINTTTGVGSLIGPIGFDANFGQDLEWDSASGTMYMVCFNSGLLEGEVRTVDLGTGMTTLVGDLIPSESGTQMAWAAIQNPTILSISESAFNNFALAPNPANGLLRVSSEISKISFVNVLGQRVYEIVDPIATEFDISSLSQGMYLVEIQIDQEKAVFQLVVE
ncbi:MAG: hypothetical protein Aureis2KO_31370 [Aureisphaera sp.]